MSFTNKTANYELPQWLADDKPTFLSDLNGAFSDIDTAMKNNSNAAASAQSTADANTLSINGITTDLDGAGGVKARLSAVETAESNTEGAVNTINSLIGNGTPTTTDQTIIGAINEIVAFTGEGPLDTTAQTVTGAINELVAGGTGAGSLDALSDVDITSPANGQTLVYNSTSQKWENQSSGSGSGNLSYDGNHKYEATADGVKTVSALFDEIRTAFNTRLASKGTDYRFRCVKLIVGATISKTLYAVDPGLYDKTYNENIAFNLIEVASELTAYKAALLTSGSVLVNVTNTGTPGNLSSTVLTDGAKVEMIVEEYSV